MKLVSLACPHCKAPLQVNQELTMATCNYCGYQFVIDNENKYVQISDEDTERIGRAAERARAENEERITTETAQKVLAVYEGLRKLRENNARITKLNEVTRENQSKLKTMKVLQWCTEPIKGEIVVGVLAFQIMLGAIGSMIEESEGAGILFAGLIASGVIYLVMRLLRTYSDNMVNRLMSEQTQMDAEIGVLNSDNQNMKFTADFEYIPVPYRNEAALGYMYQALSVKRARTLAEAMSQYDVEQQRINYERQHNYQMQQMNAQLKAAQEQARAAQAQAQVQQGADILGTVVTAGVVLKVGKDIVKTLRSLI